MNIQLCDLLRDGAGRGSDSGTGLGTALRKMRMARLQALPGHHILACGNQMWQVKIPV